MIERNSGPGTRAGFTIAEVTLIIDDGEPPPRPRTRIALDHARFPSGPGTRAGFTIAEVTLIIVVLAVLFALLLPRMNAFLRRGQLRSAMAELTEEIGR